MNTECSRLTRLCSWIPDQVRDDGKGGAAGAPVLGRFVEPRPVEEAGAGHAGVHQRKRGAAEAAFGGEAADIPLGAAAARAMVDLVAAVSDVEAAHGGVRQPAPTLALTAFDHAQHRLVLRSAAADAATNRS